MSLSLLVQIDPKKKIHKEFSLGMSDWTDSAHEESGKVNGVFSSDDNDFKQQPAMKKARLNKQSMSLTKPSSY